MTQALCYQHMSAFYGTSQILHGIDFEVYPGEVVCLLGLNGMGKTTTLRATMGLVDRIEGTIALNGVPLAGPAYRRSQMGVTLVPEDRKVFANLTVEENLRVAIRKPTKGAGVGIEDTIRIFPRLGERLEQKGGTLSGGEQQMLVVARAMLANPHYMMLDEPTEGLAPSYIDAIRDSIVAVKALGVGVILVEQSLPLAQSVGDRFHVIENGQIVRSFTRDEVVADPQCLVDMLTVD
ncbi:ABC transporter ATP-binding protein [Corticibacterium sp. UT-5YL-CI-8]|nr:ABC transporter ATP-binding protein [Tianweitania sp. UT-5YL-CI-8]